MVLRDDQLTPRPRASISFFAASMEERVYFDWFQCRTATKLPGSFRSSFWDSLLFQASLNEPAVLHAVLTLSSVHKRQVLGESRNGPDGGTPYEQEKFMLQHYSKAISNLQPHFSKKDNASVRTALISCVIFVSLELLRGRFRTAQLHLKNGIKVLGEMHGSTDADDNDDVVTLKPSMEPIDDCIAETLCRLHLQVMIFEQSFQQPRMIVLHTWERGPPVFTYHSFYDAWKPLERLLNEVFHLAKQYQQRPSFGDPSPLFGQQKRIQVELAQWLNSYNASRENLKREDSEGLGYYVLRMYHAMTKIMATTCLRPIEDESAFDLCTNDFISLLNLAIVMQKMRGFGGKSNLPPGQQFTMSKSIVDFGWIPALYYTALKCRAHRVRVQAVQSMESTSHREGFWDSRIAARVGRKVVEMEERGFYGDIGMDDDFAISSSHTERALSEPVLPQAYRFHEVKVALPDGPADKISLFCRQRQSGGNWKERLAKYNVLLECWADDSVEEDDK